MIRAALLVLCLFATPLAAQEVIGTSVIGGKRVELLSDKSWRYKETPSSDGKCVPVNTVLEFCGSFLDWRPASTAGTDFLRIFRHSDRLYAGIIYEQIGTQDDITMETMRHIVLENAAAAAFVPVDEIPVMEINPIEIDGLFGEKIVYGAQVSGLNVVYQNAIYLDQQANFQFLVWNIGKDLSETEIALFDSFIASIRLLLPENDI